MTPILIIVITLLWVTIFYLSFRYVTNQVTIEKTDEETDENGQDRIEISLEGWITADKDDIEAIMEGNVDILFNTLLKNVFHPESQCYVSMENQMYKKVLHIKENDEILIPANIQDENDLSKIYETIIHEYHGQRLCVEDFLNARKVPAGISIGDASKLYMRITNAVNRNKITT